MASNVVQDSMDRIPFREQITMIRNGWLGPETPIRCKPCDGKGKTRINQGPEAGNSREVTCLICEGKGIIPYAEYMVPRTS